MSYDELPPGSESAPNQDSAPDSVPEASSQDAPPAAPARRRRARAAESDAASAPQPSSGDPPASSKRRRKAAEPTTAASNPQHTPASTPAESSSKSSSNEPADVKPVRRRTSTRTTVEATPAEPASTTETSAPEPAAKPVPRSRRAKSPPSTEPVPADTTPETSIESAPTAAADAPVPAARRRGVRTKRTDNAPFSRVEPQPTSDADTSRLPDSPEPEAAQTGAEKPVAPIDASADDSGSPVNPKRRRERTRRAKSIDAAALPAVDSVIDNAALPLEISTAPTGAETDSVSADVDEDGNKRGRRNRRGGRNRRGDKNQEEPIAAAAVVETAVEPEPVIEVVYEEPIDLAVGAHLVPHNGVPQIRIDDIPFPPVLFFGNMEDSGSSERVISEVRRAAEAGVHLHSTLVELICPLGETSAALDAIDARLRALIDADPDGYIMPRIVFVPARGWKREYPTEIASYADDSKGDPSITSERFWQACERSLTTLIEHLGQQLWGGRVFAYHLERGEWFQPADLGYDRSTANRDAFRDWLREKYKDSLILLRAAWYDGNVQFHTAEIPAVPAKPVMQRAFYEPRRERSTIDFQEFTSESTARRLIALARAVKKASANNALVSVCYGYTFEFGHGFSGHLALDMLLRSTAIDLISGPPSYRDRKPMGAASLPAPVSSLALYNKLWISEDDTKTYLAPELQDPEDFNPRLTDLNSTEQAQARSIGRALATGTGIGWMDLWGEGWLDNADLWTTIRAYTDQAKLTQGKPDSPEVIALIDEKSLLHIQKGEPFFRRLTNGLRDTLQRAGVSSGTYLQSDLLTDTFPTDAKLYLFLTPYRLTTEQRAAIKEKLQNGGKTLAFLYAPGTCEARPGVGGVMEEVATNAIGLTLRQQEWNSEVGSRIVEPQHPLTDRLPGREIGNRERLNPSFYVDDPDAIVLAEYHQTGLPSMAVKNLGAWKSVFVGDPVLPLELLRGICRYAGVHLWTAGGEDVVTIGNGWVSVHAARDGQRTLRLPFRTGLYDVTASRLVADETREYRYFLKAGATQTFCVGTTEQLFARGLPDISLPETGRDRILLDDKNDVRTDSRSDNRNDYRNDSRSDNENEGRNEGRNDSRNENRNDTRNENRNERGDRSTRGTTGDPLPRVEPTIHADLSQNRLDNSALDNRVDNEASIGGSQSVSRPESSDISPRPERTSRPERTGRFDRMEKNRTDRDRNDRTDKSTSGGQPPSAPESRPAPRRAPREPQRPLLSSRELDSNSDALREDLETLKAVLAMPMPEDSEDEFASEARATVLDETAKVDLQAVDARIEALIGGLPGSDEAGARRRRRRGGRGRGRRRVGSSLEGDDVLAADGASENPERALMPPPGFSAPPKPSSEQNFDRDSSREVKRDSEPDFSDDNEPA